MAEMEVGPQEEMANPQGMIVFAVERPGLPEDFVSFPALCGVQSSPLVFAPNLPIVWGPLVASSRSHPIFNDQRRRRHQQAPRHRRSLLHYV